MAPILVEVCDGGYGENVIKEGGVMEMFALTGDHLVVSEMGIFAPTTARNGRPV